MFESAGVRLFLGDCMEAMRGMKDGEYALAICDPPWGISAGLKAKYHAGAFTEYIPKPWDNARPSKQYFDDLFRVTTDQIIWGANYFTEFLPAAKNWIVWDKKQPEGISLSMHELAFYSGDGQAKIYRGYNGANRCVVEGLAQKYIRIHPTQKPVRLYEWLLKNYAKPGDTILDTHGGSMSLAIACHVMGYKADIWEIDEDYYTAAVERFKRHIRQGVLEL